MKNWVSILFVWWYVVAPAMTVQRPDGRVVSWPGALEGPYLEEAQCKRRAEAVSNRYRVPAYCEPSEVLRELRGVWVR